MAIEVETIATTGAAGASTVGALSFEDAASRAMASMVSSATASMYFSELANARVAHGLLDVVQLRLLTRELGSEEVAQKVRVQAVG